MTRKPAHDWFSIGLDAWQLWGDAATVIWLRSLRLAEGGQRGQLEAQRMFAEKLAANAAFATSLATGKAGQTPDAVARKALGHYGKRVRANRRRLSR